MEPRARRSPGAELMAHRDAYGNEVRWFQLTEPHELLVVEAEAIVDDPPGAARRRPTATTPSRASPTRPTCDRYAEFLAGSTHIRWTEPVDLFARALPLDEESGASWLGARASRPRSTARSPTRRA